MYKRQDLALALAAIPLNDHHPLAFVAGDQTIPDELLQGGNVLRVKPVSYTHLI